MGYSTELTQAPDQVTVGEEFTVELEVCYDGSGPTGRSMDLKLGGEVVAPANVPAFETCIPFSGPVTISSPGDYTLSWPEGSKTITAVEPQIDPGLVTSSCSIIAPTEPFPGDQITLEGGVNNDNTIPVDVEVAFTFGNATETQTITVPAGDQETVTQPFTPDEPGEFAPDVTHTVL